MKIEELKPFVPTPDDAGRSPGLHVSGLIHHLQRAAKLRQYKLASKVTGEEWQRAYSRWEAGFVWEHMMTRAYAQRRQAEAGAKCAVQYEAEKDDVYGTIDLLDLPLWEVVEYKFTLLSANKAREIDPRSPRWPAWASAWGWQIQAYCYMVEASTAQLHVMFGAGNYRGSGPVIKGWRFSFSANELRRNWDMLLANRDAAQKDKRRWALDG